jgi:hypothetical protein
MLDNFMLSFNLCSFTVSDTHVFCFTWGSMVEHLLKSYLTLCNLAIITGTILMTEKMTETRIPMVGVLMMRMIWRTCEILMVLSVMRSNSSERTLPISVHSLIHIQESVCQMWTHCTETIYSFFHTETLKPMILNYQRNREIPFLNLRWVLRLVDMWLSFLNSWISPPQVKEKS